MWLDGQERGSGTTLSRFKSQFFHLSWTACLRCLSFPLL